MGGNLFMLQPAGEMWIFWFLLVRQINWKLFFFSSVSNWLMFEPRLIEIWSTWEVGEHQRCIKVWLRPILSSNEFSPKFPRCFIHCVLIRTQWKFVGRLMTIYRVVTKWWLVANFLNEKVVIAGWFFGWLAPGKLQQVVWRLHTYNHSIWNAIFEFSHLKLQLAA